VTGPALALVAFLAVAPAAAEGPDERRYLAVFSRAASGDRISYSIVYPDIATATRAAEKIGLCGFWRVDFETLNSSLVPPGSVVEVYLHDLSAPPPAQAGGGGGELPPPPDVEAIVDCPAARMLHLPVVPAGQ
jgi:hypothetical protein